MAAPWRVDACQIEGLAMEWAPGSCTIRFTVPDYPNNRSDWIWSQINFCNGNVCNGRNGRVTDKIGIITKRPRDISLRAEFDADSHGDLGFCSFRQRRAVFGNSCH